MKEIGKILGNYKLVKKDFYYTLLTRIINISLVLYIPILTKKVYEIIETKRSLEELYYSIGLLALLILVTVILSLFANLFQVRLWLNLYAEKNLLYRKLIIEKNYKILFNIGTGKVLTRLESGAHAEVEIFTKILKIIYDVIFQGTIIIIILSFYMINILWVILLSIIFLYITVYFLIKYINKYNKLEQDCWEEDGRNKVKITMEQFNINLYGKKEYELEKSRKNLFQAVKYGIKVDIANEFFYKAIIIIVKGLEVFVLFFIGGLIITTGEYNISHLIMFTWYFVLLWEPLENAINHINSINRVWEKYSKLQKFVEIQNDIINGIEKFEYKKGEIAEIPPIFL